MEWGEPCEEDSPGELEDGLFREKERGSWLAQIFYSQHSFDVQMVLAFCK